MTTKLTPHMIRAIFNLMLQKKNKSEIANKLKVSRKSLYNWFAKGWDRSKRLENYGEFTWNDEMYYNLYEAITLAERLVFMSLEEGDPPPITFFVKRRRR